MPTRPTLPPPAAGPGLLRAGAPAGAGPGGHDGISTHFTISGAVVWRIDVDRTTRDGRAWAVPWLDLDAVADAYPLADRDATGHADPVAGDAGAPDDRGADATDRCADRHARRFGRRRRGHREPAVTLGPEFPDPMEYDGG